MRIAESPERAAEMGRAGILRVKQSFTLEQSVASTLAVYERALA
jgi:hypothetical protein